LDRATGLSEDRPWLGIGVSVLSSTNLQPALTTVEPRIRLEPDTDRVLTLTMSIPFIGRLVDYAGARKVILSATSGCVFGGKLTAL